MTCGVARQRIVVHELNMSTAAGQHAEVDQLRAFGTSVWFINNRCAPTESAIAL